MKNTDIALIILIAAIATVASYFIANAILGDPSDSVEEITYVSGVDSEVEEPDVETFNIYSYNPTVDVYIGRCQVGQVYIAETHSCRDINTDDITLEIIDPDDDDSDLGDDED